MPARLPEELRKVVQPLLGALLENLYPPQKAALEAGVLEGESVLLCSGTGSGKTLIAELAAVGTVLKGRKVMYISPLRALAGEKYEEFRKYSPSMKVALSMGGLDEADERLGGYDMVFLTTEKLDALMRHRAEWLGRTGLLVVDEIHELGSDRGPPLESVIVKLRRTVPDVQILALSATVGNAGEIAKWLGARLVKSDFRPVPLHEGVLVSDTITFSDGRKHRVPAEGAEGAVEDCLKGGHQSLMFLNTRKSAEKAAEDLAETARRHLKKEEIAQLQAIAEKALDALPSPTTQCERLAACIRQGTAFHHAGLVHSQKLLVEDAFRRGLVRFLAATVTLVAGMNLPARRIIIKGLVRWGSDGPADWTVSLYKQAVGRAGRAGYDSIGESVVLAKSEGEAELIFARYVRGEPEDVYSQMGRQPVLRRETLGAIASGFAGSTRQLLEFFESTFYAHQYGDIAAIRSVILDVLEELREWGFVTGGGDAPAAETGGGLPNGFIELGKMLSRGGGKDEIGLTKIGRRVAELYIDPLTAHELLESLASGKEVDAFGNLLLVANTFEMRPGPSVKAREEEGLWTLARQKKLYAAVPDPWDLETDQFIRAVKMAAALELWIEETSDKDIMERLSIAPGDLRTKLLNADWVCYSAAELARLTGRKKEASELLKLQMRLEHGAREELLPLVRLRGIGRVKARRLFASGLKTPEAVLNTRKEALAKLVGEKTAEGLLKRNR